MGSSRLVGVFDELAKNRLQNTGNPVNRIDWKSDNSKYGCKYGCSFQMQYVIDCVWSVVLIHHVSFDYLLVSLVFHMKYY